MFFTSFAFKIIVIVYQLITQVLLYIILKASNLMRQLAHLKKFYSYLTLQQQTFINNSFSYFSQFFFGGLFFGCFFSSYLFLSCPSFSYSLFGCLFSSFSSSNYLLFDCPNSEYSSLNTDSSRCTNIKSTSLRYINFSGS